MEQIKNKKRKRRKINKQKKNSIVLKKKRSFSHGFFQMLSFPKDDKYSNPGGQRERPREMHSCQPALALVLLDTFP